MARCSIVRLCLGAIILSSAAGTAGCAKLFVWHGPSELESAAETPAKPQLLGGSYVQPDAGLPPGASSEKEAPIQASVAQAFFVGETLHVKVRVLAKTSLPAEKLIVGVLGLREGQVVETHYQRLLEVLNDRTLVRGNSALVPFELSAKNLTEYQVRCSWGDEAVTLWAQQPAVQAVAPQAPAPAEEARAMGPLSSDVMAPEPIKPPLPDKTRLESSKGRDDSNAKPAPAPSALASVSIEDVELEQKPTKCGSPPCDLEYTLRARVVNQSNQSLSGITLAVGIAWSESKKLPQGPATGDARQAGEELVDLSNAVLQPGQGKKLRVKVARAVPVVPGGAFLPYIRLVESKFAQQ